MSLSHQTAYSSWQSPISGEHVVSNASTIAYSLLKIKFSILNIWLFIITVVIILTSIIWNSDNNSWNSYFINITILSRQDLYCIILTLLSWTVILICIQFITQYFILPATLPTVYSKEFKQRIPAIKHKRNINNRSEKQKLSLLSVKDDRKYEESKADIDQKGIKESVFKRDTTIPRTITAFITKCSLCCQH
eukprot:221394_1